MNELEQRVEKLEQELPTLKCIQMRHRMTRARDGWCKQTRTLEQVKEFGELCKVAVFHLRELSVFKQKAPHRKTENKHNKHADHNDLRDFFYLLVHRAHLLKSEIKERVE